MVNRLLLEVPKDIDLTTLQVDDPAVKVAIDYILKFAVKDSDLARAAIVLGWASSNSAALILDLQDKLIKAEL